MIDKELYTEPKMLRLHTAPANGRGGANRIIMLGDHRTKFNNETIDIIHDDTACVEGLEVVFGTGKVTKTTMKKFSDVVAADISAYYDSGITTLPLLEAALRARHPTEFSDDSMVTVVLFTYTAAS